MSDTMVEGISEEELRWALYKPRGGNYINPEQCAAGIQSGYHSYQCTRKGTVEECGYRWCKQHAPSNVKARQDLREEKWRAQSKYNTAKWQTADAYKDVANKAIGYFKQENSFDDLEEAVSTYERLKATRDELKL